MHQNDLQKLMNNEKNLALTKITKTLGIEIKFYETTTDLQSDSKALSLNC